MADIDIAYDPITVNSGPVTVALTGLDNIKLSIPEPIKTESTLKTPDTLKSDGKFALTIPEPVRTDSKVALQSDSKLDVKTGIDLEPVVLDQCLRISLGPLPPTRVCLPNHQHVGFSFFGMEIFGITWHGEAQVLIGPPEKQTTIVGRNHTAAASGGDVRIRLGS